MRQLWVWMLLMALAFVNDRCHCCLQEERSGLLEIKAWFIHAGAASSGLRGWDKEDLNCCNWFRVSCDNTANRVTGLVLSAVNDGALGKDLYLNASLFLPFKELDYLDLSRNHLVGGLKNPGWCEMKNLEQLSLHQNNLKGVLPPCLGNLSSLKDLDLSDNQFEGNIAFSPLSHLPQLEYLSISNNYFQVPVSFGSFMNHSNLKEIYCDNNELVPSSSFQPSVPKLQLHYFSASRCTSKLLNAGFLSFLRSQYALIAVDLSHNKFIAEPFPSWLVENNTILSGLHLRNTSLEGPLQLPQNPRPSLDIIDLSDNNIQGCIPLCFGNMSSLEQLDLSYNHMSCELLEHNSPSIGYSLIYLKLSNNNFSGRLTPSVFNGTGLYYLFLDGNKFVGELPGIIDCVLGEKEKQSNSREDLQKSNGLPLCPQNVRDIFELCVATKFLTLYF